MGGQAGDRAAAAAAGGERVVVVSGFSAALDAAAVVCRDLGLPADRLDGRVPPNARSGLVRDFNRGSGGRVMLLSCVAGGAGLNLVGASRLILFDTSWNPAHDRQAMARVWRDGQTRPVTIYRLLAAGTVEEKVFQRQLAKQALTSVVDGRGSGLEQMSMTTEDLQQLFSLDVECPSDTHRTCDCTRCPDVHRKIEENTTTTMMNHSTFRARITRLVVV